MFVWVYKGEYLLLQDPLLLLQRNALVVLDRNNDGVDSFRHHSSILLVIMYRHLWDKHKVKKFA